MTQAAPHPVSRGCVSWGDRNCGINDSGKSLIMAWINDEKFGVNQQVPKHSSPRRGTAKRWILDPYWPQKPDHEELQLLPFPMLHPVQLCRWEWYVSLGQVPKIAGIRLHTANADAAVTHCVPCLMFSAVPGWTLEVALIKETLSSCSLFSLSCFI